MAKISNESSMRICPLYANLWYFFLSAFQKILDSYIFCISKNIQTPSSFDDTTTDRESKQYLPQSEETR